MNRGLFSISLMVVAVALVAGLQGAAQADTTLIQHVGMTDPTTEGFTLSPNGSPARFSADPGWDGQSNNSPAGEDAWWFAGAGGSLSALGSYNYTPTAGQLASMDSSGWKAEMRVLDNLVSGSGGPDNGADYGVGLNLLTATRDFEIYVGTDDSDNVTLHRWTASGTEQLTIPVINAKYAYHTYNMTAAPGATQATISIDGAVVGTVDGIEGSYTPMFGFGSFSSNGVFSVDYSHVSLSTVPEPSTLALLSAAACGLVCYAWRKRK
jgi:hypothetical protein